MAEYVSDHLKAISRRLAECRHGGIVLNGEGLESFIRRIDEVTEMARELECALSKSEWNRRAAGDKVRKAQRQAQVLAAIRVPGTNVRLFPVVPRPRDGGGDAA